MVKEKTLYEEVWEYRFPKRQTIEEELLALRELDPHLAKDLHSLFSEAVTDSLANILEESGARALVRRMGESSFESPTKVYGVLDSIFHDGSKVLKTAIAEEFRTSVHLLLKKVERAYSQAMSKAYVPRNQENRLPTDFRQSEGLP